MNYIKLFVRFLKEYNAYEAFLFNRKNSKGADKRFEEKIKAKQIIPHDFLLDAFPWFYTREGEAYWDDLHMAWQYYLDFKKNAIIAQW